VGPPGLAAEGDRGGRGRRGGALDGQQGFRYGRAAELSLAGAPPTVEITDLGPERPTRSIGYVTTPELGRSLAVRALIRELRHHTSRPAPVS
jgi:hypothetical protein